tara:strand:- start:712 stop:861 length:150 start_codon:yes stop_codon:yes gene_type:complete
MLTENAEALQKLAESEALESEATEEEGATDLPSEPSSSQDDQSTQSPSE